MGRKLAIDFGLKRTGLAITDEMNIIASPLETVESIHLMDRLKQIVEEFNVDVIVLGNPKNLQNKDTHISENVRLFQQALVSEFASLEIIMIDERFTSSIAMNAMISGGASKKQRREKGALDKISAAIILQSYLDQFNS